VEVEPDKILVADTTNACEAIQQFRAQRPAATLMDVQMPGMNGLDTSGAIRAEFPDAKIIVLTTYFGDAQASEGWSRRSALRGTSPRRANRAKGRAAGVRPGQIQQSGQDEPARYGSRCYSAPPFDIASLCPTRRRSPTNPD